ncbi:uncharacterized protein K02A2.6-like [Pecten maximus]|uniref:uncharacterized protein K02A2.6-like n=1 Tax=Pecten maximus TaxID=6579 RepID=UPI001458B41C|nr:uncharacterized protein K02A2.6-like [Pecten maximus]
MGPKPYAVLHDLTAPDLPGGKTYAQLVEILGGHFNPQPLQIAERFRFHKRDQKEGEPIREFNAAIRKLSEHCGFGAVLEETLRDRLVCGLRNEQIQRKLLSEDGLTYKNALDISIAMETASRDAIELQKEKQQSVNKINKFKQNNNRKHMNKKKGSTEHKGTSGSCFRCGGTNHTAADCYFKESLCHGCKKKGHIKKACMEKQFKKGKVYSLNHEDDDEETLLGSFTVKNLNSDVIWVNPEVNGKLISMELDTGSPVTIVPASVYRKHFKDHELETTTLKLKTYAGDTINPLGLLQARVKLNGQTAVLPIHVVSDKCKGPPLLGRNWLSALTLDWTEIKKAKNENLHYHTDVKDQNLLKQKYASVFKEELGTLKDITAQIKVKPGSDSKFCKARTVPYAIKPKVEAELLRLVSTGILKKVETSEWATPIVPIPKKDGSVRICGDFKVTINPVLDVDQYPLPKIEDIFASLAGGKQFTKLDLKQAYLQMEVKEEDRKFLTINTHLGLFQYQRLVFGIASAPAIWQRAMDQVLQGISGVQCILDDMIVTGGTRDEHMQTLETVLQRLDTFGLRLNNEKCAYMLDKIEFCGHVIDKDGIHKTGEKVDAVVNAPNPTNVS